jgi:sugar phosphate isomerase/epimerase
MSMHKTSSARRELMMSICELTLPETSFAEDIQLARETGYSGLSIDERKLGAGKDSELLTIFQESELRAAVCCTSVTSILSFGPEGPWPLPPEPADRIEVICAGIRRLAPFRPDTVFCATGAAGTLDRKEARKIVVEGLRRINETAGEVGVTLSLEPITARPGALGSLVTTMGETLELLADVGGPEIQVLADVWHLFDTPNFLSDLRKHAGRVSAIHACDYRVPRSPADRLMPGDGQSDVVAIFTAAEDGGFTGWYDLEVFSDELQQLPPREFMSRGAEAIRRCWNASQV